MRKVNEHSRLSAKDEFELHKRHTIPKSNVLVDYSKESKNINDVLHKAHKGEDPHAGRLKDYAQKLHLTIEQLSSTMAGVRTTEPIEVFTGIKFSPIDKWRERKVDLSMPIVMHNPAFTSTTTSIDVALKFAVFVATPIATMGVKNQSEFKSGSVMCKNVLKMMIPGGYNAGSLLESSVLKFEKEFLVQKGMDLRIHPKPEFHLEGGKAVLVWQCEII